jgi:hypothetical protein
MSSQLSAKSLLKNDHNPMRLQRTIFGKHRFLQHYPEFNVLLPVHLAIFLAENQLDAPLLIDLFILFFKSLIPTVTSHAHQYELTITEAVLKQFCLP